MELLDIYSRLAGLRTSLVAKSVLIAGRLARSRALQRLLRMSGARVTAAEDVETALHLARRIDIDLVVGDDDTDEDTADAFVMALRRRSPYRTGPCFVRLSMG